jgi:hypothetical protein
MADGVNIIYETNETNGAKPVLMTWDGKTTSSGQPFLNSALPHLAQTRPDVDVNASGKVAFTGVVNNSSRVFIANANGET